MLSLNPPVPLVGLPQFAVELPVPQRLKIRRILQALGAALPAAARGRSCILSTLILCDMLQEQGIPAQPIACTLTLEMPAGSHHVGRPEAGQVVPPGQWGGHLVCRAGDWLIDPTTAQLAVAGLGPVPPMAVAQWSPLIVAPSLPLGVGRLIWETDLGNDGWRRTLDARPALRRPFLTAMRAELENAAAGDDGDGLPEARVKTDAAGEFGRGRLQRAFTASRQAFFGARLP